MTNPGMSEDIQSSGGKRILRWAVVVYLVTFAINLVMYFFRSNDVLFFVLGGYGMMWVPGIIAIIFAAPGQRRKELGVKLAAPKYFLVALVLPFLTHALLVLGSSLLGQGISPDALVSGESGFQAGPIAAPFFGPKDAQGTALVAVILANQALLLLLGCVERITRTLGEELGWRGWLQPKLAGKAPLMGTLLVGCVWGFWHAPLILMGHNFPENPVTGAFLLMPALSVGLAFPLAWLRQQSGSVWPCALFHASVNATSSLAIGWMGRTALPTSMVILWVFIGAAFALLLRSQSMTPFVGIAAPT
jgi:membrane protease YdiL (CAAX protease family)